MELHKQLEAELIKRFLNQLDEVERLALGEPPKITVIFADGGIEAVEKAEKISFLLSPAKPVLHIQVEGDGHFWALFFIEERYIKAAGRVGFTHLSFGFASDRVGMAFRCQNR